MGLLHEEPNQTNISLMRIDQDVELSTQNNGGPPEQQEPPENESAGDDSQELREKAESPRSRLARFFSGKIQTLKDMLFETDGETNRGLVDKMSYDELKALIPPENIQKMHNKKLLVVRLMIIA